MLGGAGCGLVLPGARREMRMRERIDEEPAPRALPIAICPPPCPRPCNPSAPSPLSEPPHRPEVCGEPRRLPRPRLRRMPTSEASLPRRSARPWLSVLYCFHEPRDRRNGEPINRGDCMIWTRHVPFVRVRLPGPGAELALVLTPHLGPRFPNFFVARATQLVAYDSQGPGTLSCLCCDLLPTSLPLTALGDSLQELLRHNAPPPSQCWGHSQQQHTFLLLGGCLLAWMAMAQYAVLVFIPAFCAVALFQSVSPEKVHRWTFSFQMTWQTLCHLGLHYTEYYLQEPPCVRFCITLSSLMLLTQRVTWLSLDICEGQVVVKEAWGGPCVLSFCSYLLFFPALLGGPLCSFQRFQAQVNRPESLWRPLSLGPAARKGLLLLGLELLKTLVRGMLGAGPGLASCHRLGCISVMWTAAVLYKLTYYSHWILDESLLWAAGFGLDSGPPLRGEGDVSDADIWTLETTHRISLFTRTWNQSTTRWLRRLVFSRATAWPLMQTFAFSAWWHGLHPGQVFGFLCWAMMVEADYLIHGRAKELISSWPGRLLYRAVSWAHTQLIIAYILLAVELRSLSALRLLGASYNSLFPLVYCVCLVLLARRRKRGASPATFTQ
ncbi:ghrelin O-acyltransferase [Dromiciops gliroides]|uniref:ghrelin O-acyltransferase n=1 Tax=Dromiciops gliroides TaxID=33562 RepID=UPI001CC6B665|nr:ghrelin O-acyltransferase [Dromiciops gliroides]